jgi:predicted enzyme related to lactoylglutathione lyase
MANPFCHVELTTDDPKKSRDFYGKVFDWKFEETPSPVPGGLYTHIKVGDGTGGGLMKNPMPEAGNHWMPYVLVDDVDATIGRARKLGAKVIVEKITVPGMGAFAVFVDPSGAALGVWQVAKSS